MQVQLRRRRGSLARGQAGVFAAAAGISRLPTDKYGALILLDCED